MESLFSFPVGLFHPLQHAGLSRRTPSSRPSVSYRSGSHRNAKYNHFYDLRVIRKWETVDLT
jgi:hypothetical protein